MAKKKIGIKIPTLKELNKSFPTSFVASERDDSNFPKIPTDSLHIIINWEEVLHLVG